MLLSYCVMYFCAISRCLTNVRDFIGVYAVYYYKWFYQPFGCVLALIFY